MHHPPKAVVPVGVGTLLVLLAGSLGGSMVAPRLAEAATVYVRVSGSDLNDGTAANRALRTIARAASVAKTGDRIVVGPGTYNEGNIEPAAFARVSFVADRRGTAVGEPAGDVVVDARTFNNGFLLNHKLSATIDGFVVYGAVNGIYVKSNSDQAVISNCVVSGNGDNGIYIQDSRGVTVFNNLVYNNSTGAGILVTGSVSGSPGAHVINNTVYKNGNRGIFFSGSTIGSAGGLVLNNLTGANKTAGIQVNAISRDGYVSGGNVFNDKGASGTPIDVTDTNQRVDPVFVQDDPSGPDGILGGTGYADDDFHLAQRAAGQAATSPAVDAGSDSARRLKLRRATTRSDGRHDSGLVDAGYHYRSFDALPLRPELSVRHASLYVNGSSGADINSGRSPTQPLQSLARAFQIAKAGDRILLQAGTVQEGQLSLARSGTRGRDIIIQGLPGAHIDATGFARGILIGGRSFVTIVGLDISGAKEAAIEIRANSDHVTVRRCRLHHNQLRGLRVTDSALITAQGDIIDSNGSRGIHTDNAQLDVVRNVLAGNGDQGLWATNNSLVNVAASAMVDNTNAGLQAEASTVMVTDGVIQGGTDGGARFLKGSTGTLKDVAVTDTDDAGIQSVSSLVNVAGGSVTGNARAGIEGIVDSSTHQTNALAVSGTRVCGNNGPGVHGQDSALTLTDVTLCSNATEGVRQNGGTLQVARATITQNQGKGLSLTGLDGLTLQGGEISDNGDAGVYLNTSGASSMRDALVTANDGDGIVALQNTAPLNVSGGQLTGNAGAGVLADDSTVSLTDVRVVDNGSGARFTSGAIGTLTRAVVTTNTDTGIQGLSSSVTVKDGRVESNGRLGIDSIIDTARGGTTQLSLDGTRVCSNSGPGIHAQGSTLALARATICLNMEEGVRQSGGSAQITDATIMQNGGRGISADALTAFALRRAMVTGNSDNGVQVLDTPTVDIGDAMVSTNGANGLLVTGDTALSVAKSQFVDNVVVGVLAQQTSSSFTDVTISGSGQDGLRQSGGDAQILRATIHDNQGRGISAAPLVTDSGPRTLLDEFALQDSSIGRNGGNGVQVVNASATSIGASTVYANQGDGITLLDTPGPIVWNNLVYANASTGVLISGDTDGSPNAQVLNNTVYGSGNRGVFIGGDETKPASAGALVLRNIFQGNAFAGLQVNTMSVPYQGDYNLNADMYGASAQPGTHDIFSPALFIDPTALLPDFHLSQRPAGQAATSPAVDAGGTDVPTAGLQGTSTRTDGVADNGIVDLGFHFQ